MRVVVAASGAILASAVFLVPSVVRAEDQLLQPGISVRVDSIPVGMSVQIERADSGPAVLECFDACSTVVDPGRYRLRLRTSTGETVGTETMSIKHPIVFHVSSFSREAATTGLVLGVTGAGLAATSVVAFGIVLSNACESGGCGALVVYGIVALLSGAALTPVGWTMFVQNRQWFRGDGPSEQGARPAPTLRFGVLPRPGGASGVMSLAF
jgi:hypothetical protein